MSTKKKARKVGKQDPNRRRRIWDTIPEGGKTIDEIDLACIGTRHATAQTVIKMVNEGYLTGRSGQQADPRIVTYYRKAGVEPPPIRGDYVPSVTTMARDKGDSTLDLADKIETGILYLLELVEQVRPRLVTDELIEELNELRAFKANVEANLQKVGLKKN